MSELHPLYAFLTPCHTQALEGSMQLLDFQIIKVHTAYSQCLLLEDMGLIPFRGAPAEPTSELFQRELNHPSFRSQHGCLLSSHTGRLSMYALNRPRSGLSQSIYTLNSLPECFPSYAFPALTVLFILKDLFVQVNLSLTLSQMRLFHYGFL